MGFTGRNISRWTSKIFTLLTMTTLMFLIDVFKPYSFLLERDYQREFAYPFDVDLSRVIESLKNGEVPTIKPIYQQYNMSFIITNREKCKETRKRARRIHLLIMIKTDAENSYQRNAIRISWGQENSIPGFRIKRVFLVGTRPWLPGLQQKIENEQKLYSDLVQADFWDTYYNNTYKTMSGFKWVTQYCPNTEHVLLVDDDMYVSVRNLLYFLRNPTKYPEYFEANENTEPAAINKINTSTLFKISPIHKANKAQLLPFSGLSNVYRSKRSQSEVHNGSEITNWRIYAGFVFPSSRPRRIEVSKWYISISEYPYSHWPPYVTAGAIVLSRSALVDMYFASFYTQPFRFDDIYVAILAKKVRIAPYHCNEFYFSKKDYTSPQDYKRVIISHGYEDFQELLHLWGQQRLAGYA